MSGRDC